MLTFIPAHDGVSARSLEGITGRKRSALVLSVLYASSKTSKNAPIKTGRVGCKSWVAAGWRISRGSHDSQRGSTLVKVGVEEDVVRI